ncbi:hypothetical protein [Nocardioides panacisoli]|uniref:Secreted protein n=1 Tax=Nocardioides panacisoli TaxID=627624 RepID=A0ABP7J7E9_9ACTN
MRRRTAVLTVAAVALVGCACASASSPGGAAPAPAARGDVGSCPTFPDDNWWHADVSGLPVHARSDAWIGHMSPGVDLHPDFGPTRKYGIPVTVVDGDHRKVKVRFQYSDESDHVRYPLGSDTRIEGGAKASGDRHAIVVDKDSCTLYETWHTKKLDDGWHAGSGAVWDLRSNDLRPEGWTSADAAGLPILPGLLTWPEVRDDHIDHAIRFTVDVSSKHHIWPARHDAGSKSSCSYPPMGARFRLKADYDASDLGDDAQRVVAAMKKYGMVLADNGSDWFFQGAMSTAWPDDLISDLKTIPANEFEAVDTAGIIPADGDPC